MTACKLDWCDRTAIPRSECGLCSVHYRRRIDKGSEYYETRHEVVISEYAYLSSWGLSRNEIAERLNLSHDGLVKHLKKAALAGDPRSDWTPYVLPRSGTFQNIQARNKRKASA